MEAKAAEKIVKKHALKMMRALGISHWRVHIEYRHLHDCSAQCDLAQAKYDVATIAIDNDKAESEADLLDSLRHELLHVVAAPFAHYRAVMTAGQDRDDREHELWLYAMEQHVRVLERGLAAEVGK